MSVVEELQTAVDGVATKAGAAVVGIGHARAVGSGVVIAPDRVLTNAHNLFRGEVTVTFPGGRSEAGHPLGVDVDGDIAVLEVETGDAPVIEWPEGNGNENESIGRAVFALSNPGGRGLRVTFGLVSGTERSFRGPRGRRISGGIEHTAPLLPGSSGGPVVDADGRLLGINTHRLGEGFYLALPANAALREQVETLARGESPSRPRLGIGIAPAHVARGLRRAVGLPEVDGLLVRQVEANAPAARAGLEEGDLIVEAGGRPTVTPDDLFEALARASDGRLEIKVLHGNDERNVAVDLQGAKENPNSPPPAEP